MGTASISVAARRRCGRRAPTSRQSASVVSGQVAAFLACAALLCWFADAEGSGRGKYGSGGSRGPPNGDQAHHPTADGGVPEDGAVAIAETPPPPRTIGIPTPVSWSPHIVVVENFMSDEECDYVVARVDESESFHDTSRTGPVCASRVISGCFATLPLTMLLLCTCAGFQCVIHPRSSERR